MKLNVLLVLSLIFCSLIFSSVGAELPKITEESTEEDPFYENGICKGVEDVDLSEFNLSKDDLQKLIKKTAEDKLIQEISVAEQDLFDSDEVAATSIKITVNENGLGTVRKVIITPDKKKTYSKTLKTSEASGVLTTSISGSPQTSINAETNGDVGFKSEVNSYGPQMDEHKTITGDMAIKSNSSTKWVKKHKANVLETDSDSSSSGKISFEDEKVNPADIQLDSNVSSHSGTVFLSKKCMASKSNSNFVTKLTGDSWNSDFQGTGKGEVYSHVFAADKNGSSVSWTFAKIYAKSNLKIVVGNETITGSQFTTVKVFVETITKPLPSESSTNAKKFEISNEIKARVESKSSLDKGYKIYGTGGQIMFRNTILELPGGQGENNEELIYGLIRQEGLPDNLLTNSFVNSVMIAFD